MNGHQSTTGGIQHGGDHYLGFPIQPIDYAEENKLTATEFSVVKYVTRHRSKNGLEDLKKAAHFLQMLIFRYYGEAVSITYASDVGADQFVEQGLTAEDEENEIEHLPPKPCDAYVQQKDPIEFLGDVADSEDVDIRDRGKAMTQLRSIALDAGIPVAEIVASPNWRSVAKQIIATQGKQEVKV